MLAMWIVFLLLLLPLPVHTEDLSELSANPARLSGSFGFFGLSGLSGSSGWFAGSANETDQLDQINEIDQFRLSVLAGLGNPQYPWQFVAKSRSRVAKRARGIAKEGSVLFAVR
jgi:hypothetical protein